jgi:hypothetical protein
LLLRADETPIPASDRERTLSQRLDSRLEPVSGPAGAIMCAASSRRPSFPHRSRPRCFRMASLGRRLDVALRMASCELKLSTAREFLPSAQSSQAKWPTQRAGMATEEADGRPCSQLALWASSTQRAVVGQGLVAIRPPGRLLPRESRFNSVCNVETRECDTHVKSAGCTRSD